MSKIKRNLKWLVPNGIFSATIYFGLFAGMEGVKNIAVFCAWLCILSTMFIFQDDVEKRMKIKGRPVPNFVSMTFDVCVSMAFAYVGMWFVAGLYFLHALIVEGVYKQGDKGG